ncbi:hypothetical protein M432DRAFT_198064 [Thermoascus aurantiacus ATCC 26904]
MDCISPISPPPSRLPPAPGAGRPVFSCSSISGKIWFCRDTRQDEASLFVRCSGPKRPSHRQIAFPDAQKKNPPSINRSTIPRVYQQHDSTPSRRCQCMICWASHAATQNGGTNRLPVPALVPFVESSTTHGERATAGTHSLGMDFPILAGRFCYMAPTAMLARTYFRKSPPGPGQSIGRGRGIKDKGQGQLCLDGFTRFVILCGHRCPCRGAGTAYLDHEQEIDLPAGPLCPVALRCTESHYSS